MSPASPLPQRGRPATKKGGCLHVERVVPLRVPHARDYDGPWCPVCEYDRCRLCGTHKGLRYHSRRLGYYVCVKCTT